MRSLFPHADRNDFRKDSAMTTPSLRPAALFALAALSALAAPIAPAAAQDSAPVLSPASKFSEESGEALYANVCQACHMKNGVGATGAGTYPALASNPNLAASGYPVMMVVAGHRGMPPVGKMMSDDQVATIVNYVRTHFGNNYADAVTAKDVAGARP